MYLFGKCTHMLMDSNKKFFADRRGSSVFIISVGFLLLSLLSKAQVTEIAMNVLYLQYYTYILLLQPTSCSSQQELLCIAARLTLHLAFIPV